MLTKSLITAGILAAGITGYCLLNKNTKQKADRLLNTVMNDTTNKIKSTNYRK